MEMVIYRKGIPHVVLFDDADYDLVNQWHWVIGSNEYVYGYRKDIPRPGQYLKSMHRVILGILNQPSVYCDHINHIRTDNRRHNLRKCTKQQNLMNSVAHGRSKYMGVSISNSRGKTVITAQISFNNKKIHIGVYKTEEEAALARDELSKVLHGEFAVLNFPENK